MVRLVTRWMVGTTFRQPIVELRFPTVRIRYENEQDGRHGDDLYLDRVLDQNNKPRNSAQGGLSR